jgi:hypothetical protein
MGVPVKDEMSFDPDDEDRATMFRHIQSFSMPFISKMTLATLKTLPGNWLGVGQIAHILKRLNSMFRPLCDDFQICVLNDGNIWFSKVMRKMQKQIQIPYRSKDLDLVQDEDERLEKYKLQEAIETIFYDEIATQTSQWRRQFRMYRNAHDEGERFKFRNGCLVIVPCRVGMTKIEKCYIEPIRYIFFQPNITMGAMGGRPGQALYFTGLQGEDLIFLDPHLVQDSVDHEDEYMFRDWLQLEGMDEELYQSVAVNPQHRASILS